MAAPWHRVVDAATGTRKATDLFRRGAHRDSDGDKGGKYTPPKVPAPPQDPRPTPNNHTSPPTGGYSGHVPRYGLPVTSSQYQSHQAQSQQATPPSAGDQYGFNSPSPQNQGHSQQATPPPTGYQYGFNSPSPQNQGHSQQATPPSTGYQYSFNSPSPQNQSHQGHQSQSQQRSPTPTGPQYGFHSSSPQNQPGQQKYQQPLPSPPDQQGYGAPDSYGAHNQDSQYPPYGLSYPSQPPDTLPSAQRMLSFPPDYMHGQQQYPSQGISRAETAPPAPVFSVSTPPQIAQCTYCHTPYYWGQQQCQC